MSGGLDLDFTHSNLEFSIRHPDADGLAQRSAQDGLALADWTGWMRAGSSLHVACGYDESSLSAQRDGADSCRDILMTFVNGLL